MSQAFAQMPPGASTRAYNNSRRAMQVTLFAAYPFFLAATVLRRLYPRGAKSRQSIFAETRVRAASIIPFIFMG